MQLLSFKSLVGEKTGVFISNPIRVCMHKSILMYGFLVDIQSDSFNISVTLQ